MANAWMKTQTDHEVFKVDIVISQTEPKKTIVDLSQENINRVFLQ
jgi:hypothetical protein